MVYDSKNIISQAPTEPVHLFRRGGVYLAPEYYVESNFNLSNYICNLKIKKKQKLLFINYYHHKDSNRQNEYDFCLRKNIDNKYIDKIFCLYEGEKPHIKSNKIKYIELLNRPTYRQIFETINTITDNKSISILANNDIYFDKSIKYLDMVEDLDKNCIALSRWDYVDEGYNLRNKKDSQDVWAFLGKIKHIANMNIDFCMGIGGCDNRLAFELKNCYVRIVNPSFTIRSYHHHETGIRTYKKEERIPKPYLLITPSFLNDNFFIHNMLNIKVKKTSKRKILHLAINNKNQQSLCDALASLGEYRNIEWKKILFEKFRDDTNNLRNYLLFVINEFRPDLIFMQIQKAGIITYEFIKAVNKLYNGKEVNIINWTGDVFGQVPEWFKEIAYDNNITTLFSNFSNVEEMRALGLKADYLQIGYEEKYYNNIKINTIRKDFPEIVFMGNNYGGRFPLSKERYEMVVELKEAFGDKFAVFGGNYANHLGAKNLNNNPELEAEIYRRCKVAINFSHFLLKRYTSDRLFRIMACGALAITHKYPDMEEDFINEKHLVTFNTFYDLKKKIKFYLENEADRKRIAEAGRKLVLSKHRWINRIEDLKGILKWRS